MRRVGLVVMLLLSACGDGDTVGDDAAARVRPATTAVIASTTMATGACGLKPMTFSNERWQGSGATPPSGTGVVWEQATSPC